LRERLVLEGFFVTSNVKNIDSINHNYINIEKKDPSLFIFLKKKITHGECGKKVEQ